MILSDYSFRTIFFTISNSNTDCGIKMDYAKRLIISLYYHIFFTDKRIPKNKHIKKNIYQMPYTYRHENMHNRLAMFMFSVVY